MGFLNFAYDLPNLVVNTDKVIIVGDFNILMDNEIDQLRSALLSTIESTGFDQHTRQLTHYHSHALYVDKTYDI